MPGPTQFERRQGDYTDTELATVIATLAGVDPGRICRVAVIASYHPARGGHELIALGDDPDDWAGLLRMIESAVTQITARITLLGPLPDGGHDASRR